MFRSACDYLASKAGLDVSTDNVSDEDSSKENSLINYQTQYPSLTMPKESPGVTSPWGHTLTPRNVTPAHTPPTALQQRLMLDRTPSPATAPKQNVPWNDLSFAAEVVSPGFASRVVREAQSQTMNARSPSENRRQYPTAQERFVRAGVLPNVCLNGRTKAVLTPRRTPTAPLLPLGRSSSSTFSSSLSSDFLTSTTPRMPDIRSVASVLEPTSTSSECVRDPTSVQAVVAALQQAQVGKGIKRGSCYAEPEDLSKRQKCSTTGTVVSSSMPINYSRDYMEEGQNCSSNGTTGGGGEKRALDLSPSAQGNSRQLSPENKKRCVLDPMMASFSSSKHIVELGMLRANGRDTPFSMYDSRQDTDSESNPSVGSARSKNSEQSLHHQTSEATGGESCIISPGPSDGDPSDRSGSHTPQSTRGDSSNSSGAVGNGGTANTSRTSTPRNPTPPRPTHVISLEAYKAEKAKGQQRLKKMLGMLFHVKEGEEPQTSKSGESTPSASGSAFTLVVPASTSASLAPSLTWNSNLTSSSVTSEPSIATTVTGGLGTVLSSNSSLKNNATEENTSTSNTVAQTSSSEGTNNDVSACFTVSLKPSRISVTTSKDDNSGNKDNVKIRESDKESDVTITAMLKLPLAANDNADDVKDKEKANAENANKNNKENVTNLFSHSKKVSSDAPTSSSLVEFLKATSSAKNGTVPTLSLCGNSPLENKASTTTTSATVSEPSQFPRTSPLTPPSARAVSPGSAGPPPQTFSSPQTSASPLSMYSSAFSPTTLSLKYPQAVSSVANTFSFSAPCTTNLITNLSNTVENDASAAMSESGYTSMPADSLRHNFGVVSSSSSITSTGSVMSSGFYSNSAAPPPYASTITTQVGSAPVNTSTIGSAAESSSNSTAGVFAFGSGINAFNIQQAPFLFLDSKKSTFSNDLTTGSAVPSLGFSFSNSQTSSSATLPFGSIGTTQVTPSLSSTSYGSTLNFGSQMGTTTATAPTAFSLSTSVSGSSPFGTTSGVAAHPTFSSTTTTTTSTTTATAGPATVAAVTTQASSFTFGQTMASPSTTTATTSPFAFGSATTQVASGTSAPLFQFGRAAAPTTTVVPPQPFAPSVASTQSSTATSPLFAFDTSGTNTAASVVPIAATSTPSFTFGPPKTNTTTPTFGATTDTSAKVAAPSSFNFSSVPAATTTSAPSTGFTFGPPTSTPSAGFQFAQSATSPSNNIKSSGPYLFGNSTGKTPSFGASSASPFSFGGSTPNAQSFGTVPNQGFGAQTTSTSTFATSTPSFGTSTVNPASPFGSSNAFGASSPNSSFTPSFGSTPNVNKTNNSGGNPFGVPGAATPSFAATGMQGAAPIFAATNKPVQAPSFGSSSTTGGFGSSQTSSFGTPTFGNDKNVADKGSAFQFGQGANSTPSFATSPPTFGGATSPPTFGGAASPLSFGGATSPTAFGSGASASGAPGGPVFQFGTTNPPSFNAGNTANTRRPRARAPRRHHR
nr:putative GPI-anchored protein pfl2 [Procambarus clarkii]